MVLSLEGLKKALYPMGRDEALHITLLLPQDTEDLEELAQMFEDFCGWLVFIELPDDGWWSLRLAKPLSPRYFSFRGDSTEYLEAIIEKTAKLNSKNQQQKSTA